MSPTEPNGATLDLELTAAPNLLPATVDLRREMTSVGRIYQGSGAGTSDGHYCPYCNDWAGEFVRVRRCADHWQCRGCEAVFSD
jgi:ribosomal protein L37AE/L43A